MSTRCALGLLVLTVVPPGAQMFPPPLRETNQPFAWDRAKREEFIEAVFLKLHEVVVAIEFTAALTAHAAARMHRRHGKS